MMTLKQFASKPETIPASTSWYLADLGEARGKQELLTKQSPQRLRVLREHALIESAVSSNRIEGVNVDQARIATIIFGKSLQRDREKTSVPGGVSNVSAEDKARSGSGPPNGNRYYPINWVVN
jgi:hypothetical protein